jgi:eukaryotic-like serine/threonine-protein kinase
MSDAVQRLRAALADRYVIERQLGMGGMATVYLARDTKHDRQVALKVLRPELAAVLGTERFLSEIRVMAHLQHPHILPLHDSGQAAGLVYYVMPYVAGESLRDRLGREKQLAVEDALQITRVVASALDYAHRHDVVHRDIKPENILLPDGQAVVADFGIALALSAAAGSRLTETGLSLGTPQYMSPEQATGDRLIDNRSDIYSLACVLYEMLAGEPPHTGPTVQSVIAKVVTDRPRRLSTLRSSVPPHVEAAVHKALAKIPADRFTTVAQFAEALARPGSVPLLAPDDALAGTTGERVWQGVRWPRVVPWAVAAIAIAGAAWGWLRSSPSPPQPVARFKLTLPPEAAFLDARGVRMALSPDGARLVYMGGTSGNQQLYLRPLDRLTPVPIADTRGAYHPFFSPDGRWLGFLVEDKIRRVSLEGGAATTVCTVSGGVVSASWTTGNVIVFTARGGLGLWQVAADGGEPTLVARADTARGETYAWPEALPGGRAAVFTLRDSSGFHLAAVRLETGAVVSLGAAGANPHFVAPGYLLFARQDGALVAAPFDPNALRITGPVLLVAEGAIVGQGGATRLGVSASGSFVYQAGRVVDNVPVWVDRSGRATVVPVPPQPFYSARLSPDARSIVFDIGPSNPGPTGDVWVYDLVRSTLGRLTFDSSSLRPVWTPDGRRVAFTRLVGTGRTEAEVWWIPADRSDSAERLVGGRRAQVPAMFTPDGRALVYVAAPTGVEEVNPLRPETAGDIWVLPLMGDRTPRPYLQTPFDESFPALSPDGRWLAYTSTESGQAEVYVRIFPVPGARVQISSGGGRAPRWAPDGREIFYRSEDSLVAVSVSPAPLLRVGSRHTLFATEPYLGAGPRTGAGYDVHPDGRRFLMIRQGSATRELVVVLNWFDQLRH